MTTYTPPAEAVEAAARAAGMYGRVAQDGLTPEQQFERDWQDEEYREQARAEARAALTAAGPLIAAQALDDAADTLAAEFRNDGFPTPWLRERAARTARGEGS